MAITDYTAQDVFNRTTKGRNFMTPLLLNLDMLVPGVAVEHSRGEGLRNQAIYGVTVRAVDKDGKPDNGYDHLSRMFYDVHDSRNYINRLRRVASRGELPRMTTSNTEEAS